MIFQTRPRLRRAALGTLTSAALLGSALAAAPAQATPSDGKGEVVVSIVDAAGQPLKAMAGLVSTAGGSPTGGFGSSLASTVTSSVPAGRYGVVAIAPWGGIFCAGIDPCGYATFAGGATPATVPGAVDVQDVETPSTVRVQAPAPATVSGGNLAGQVLTVTLSRAMQEFAVLTTGAQGVQNEWLRDGVVIPGATSPAYTLTGEDVGHTIAPRLSYGPAIAGQWAMLGADAAPITLPGRAVTKSASQTKVEVFRQAIVAGKSTGLRVDVTSGAQPAQGDVRVTVGKWSVTKTLLNGSIRVPLPKKLKPGKYQVVAQYLGSGTLEASQGADQLKVKKAPKKKK